MTANKGDFIVRIDATVDDLNKALTAAERNTAKAASKIEASLSSPAKGVDKLTSAFGGLKGALAAFGVTAGIGALKNLTVDAIDAVGGLGEMAQQLGISTDTLQVLNYAATQYGLTQEEVGNGVSRLTRTIGEAADGNKKAAETFAGLGINIRDANGKVRDTDSIFREVIEAISNIEDPATRAATGADLMGRGFQKLAPIVEAGAEGFDALRMEAERLGLIFSEEVIANADVASDKMATLARVLKTQLQATLVEIAPLLTTVSQGLLDIVKGWNARAGIGGAHQIEQLKILNAEIERWRKNQQQVEEGGPVSWMATLFGTDDVPAQRIAELTKERDKILHAIMSNTDYVPPPVGGGGTGGDTASDTTGADRHAASVRELTAAVDEYLQKQSESLELLKVEGVERAKLAAVIDGQKAAARDYEAGLRESPLLGSDEISRIQEMTASIYELTEAQRASARAETERAGAAADATAAAAEGVELWRDAYGALEGSARGVISSIIDGTFNARDALAKLAESLANVALNAALGGLSSGAGGILGSLFGGGGGGLSGLPSAIARNPFDLFRAEGGPVTAGRPYVVGEERPELFVPGSSGSIIPYVPDIPEMSRFGAGGQTVYNIGPVNTKIEIKTNSQEHATEVVKRAGSAAQAAINAAIDERLAQHLRPRGMLKPNVV